MFDTLVECTVNHISPRKVLDVGCGAGKYADIVRRIQPESLIIGYEEEPSYIERFKLRKKYDDLYNISIEHIIQQDVRQQFDLCIMGDVLEHLRKSVGQDVIHFLLYRSRYILLAVPLQYLQDDHDGVRGEAHVSSWHPHEFEPYTDVIFVSKPGTWFAVLRGFLCDHSEFILLRDTIQSVENSAKYLPCRDL